MTTQNALDFTIRLTFLNFVFCVSMIKDCIYLCDDLEKRLAYASGNLECKKGD